MKKALISAFGIASASFGALLIVFNFVVRMGDSWVVASIRGDATTIFCIAVWVLVSVTLLTVGDEL